MTDDRIVTARILADSLRTRIAGGIVGSPVEVPLGTANAILQHLETLARLEEKGEELLCEAFVAQYWKTPGPSWFVGNATPFSPDGMDGPGIELEGTFELRPVLQYILGAAK